MVWLVATIGRVLSAHKCVDAAGIGRAKVVVGDAEIVTFPIDVEGADGFVNEPLELIVGDQ